MHSLVYVLRQVKQLQSQLRVSHRLLQSLYPAKTVPQYCAESVLQCRKPKAYPGPRAKTVPQYGTPQPYPGTARQNCTKYCTPKLYPSTTAGWDTLVPC
eukprot:740500-Rhodomonas_salina.1